MAATAAAAAAAAENPGQQLSAPQNPGVAEHSQHKNRLQEYVQRCGISLPVYQTVNEGSSHAPQFRSTVTIDGQKFRSTHTFAHRKEAEQDVAKFTLESISWKIKQEGCHLIRGDTTFCKSVLHEYAAKNNMEKPTYTTSRSEGLLPVFISSVVFYDKTYTGYPGRNKKEAEQIAARTAIESILGDPSMRTIMAQIIKSKRKFYAFMHKGNGSMVMRGSVESHSGNSVGKGKGPATAHTEAGQPSNATVHHTKVPKQEYTELDSGSIGSGPSIPYQPEGGPPPGPVNKDFEPVTNNSYLEHCNQLKNDILPCHSECMASASKKKRQRKKKTESIPYQPEGGPPPGPVSKGFEPVTNESNLEHCNQLKNDILPRHSEGMASASKKKRQRKKKAESIPYQPEGGPPPGPVSKGFEPVTNESHLEHCNQLKNDILPCHSEGMASASRKKRQRK